MRAFPGQSFRKGAGIGFEQTIPQIQRKLQSTENANLQGEPTGDDLALVSSRRYCRWYSARRVRRGRYRVCIVDRSRPKMSGMTPFRQIARDARTDSSRTPKPPDRNRLPSKNHGPEDRDSMGA